MTPLKSWLQVSAFKTAFKQLIIPTYNSCGRTKASVIIHLERRNDAPVGDISDYWSWDQSSHTDVSRIKYTDINSHLTVISAVPAGAVAALICNLSEASKRKTTLIPSLIPDNIIKEHNIFYRAVSYSRLPADRLVWALPLDCGAEPPGPPSSPAGLRSSQPAACCPGRLEHLRSIRQTESELVSFPHVPEKRKAARQFIMMCCRMLDYSLDVTSVCENVATEIKTREKKVSK